MTTKQTQCCIVGGGPAGMMLGYLLARAGVEVIVLEKHADFFRDFRGDTIHPSTTELMYELGLLDKFLQIPHQSLSKLSFSLNDKAMKVVDFSHLPVKCPYVALMPQWDFLNFIASEAKKYTTFRLLMQAEATDIITENDMVKGVKVKCADGDMEIRADLLIACDGRSSTIRASAGLKVLETGVPVDVLWFRVPKSDNIGEYSLGHVKNNKLIVTIDRGDYYQCAYLITKGAFDEIKQQGLQAFRNTIVVLVPALQEHIDAVKTWDDVKLLSVQINHLEQWYRPGLICIGDAAHAMSPVGGVGINLAVQDAVATANILAPAFAKNAVGIAQLKAIQARREKPTRQIQSIQTFIHNNLFNPNMKGSADNRMKIPLWIFDHLPILRRIPGWVVGMGFRPEHIQTAEKA